MELRHLRYFLAAAETRNFRKAAEALHITQPPLSRAIQDLEQQLGHRLFDRSRSGATLTSAGEKLVTEARAIVDRADTLARRFQGMHKARDGMLNVGYVGSTITTTLPRIIREFRRSPYDCDIQLFSLHKIEQVHALRAGSIDVGLSRGYPEMADIETEAIFSEPLRIAMPDTDDRAAGQSVSLPELANDRLILFPKYPRPSFPEIILEICHANGVVPANQLVVDDLVSCLGLVAAGTGISIVPYSAAEFSVAGVRFLPLDGVPHKVRQLIAYRRNEDSPAIRAFIAVCRRAGELVDFT